MEIYIVTKLIKNGDNVSSSVVCGSVINLEAKRLMKNAAEEEIMALGVSRDRVREFDDYFENCYIEIDNKDCQDPAKSLYVKFKVETIEL